MKVIFMGTPDFAVGILDSIVKSNNEVVLVVTQEDKAKGRSGKLVFSPVKEYAVANNLPVFQPKKIKTDEAIAVLNEYEADIFVVAAYGQILSKEILEMPKHGCINIHASLLPKYRGAAPIQWAIVDGEAETGVTVMQMNEGLDTGDILFVSKVSITPDETGESLFEKLENAGAMIIPEVLEKIEKGEITAVKQDDSKATYAKILDKKFGCIDFGKNADEIERLVRGFTPWPGTYSYINGKMIKILKASVEENVAVGNMTDVRNGDVAAIMKDCFTVKCGQNYLKVTEVQLEGKKRMPVSDFLRGYRLEVGDHLG